MEVGIRELKARLSHYVKLAHDGESITVTDRGSPVAVLSAPPDQHMADLPETLQQLIREGRATAPTRPMPFPTVTPVRGSRSVQEILDEDRGDD